MTENAQNPNLTERQIEIAPSPYQVLAGTKTEYGILARDVNIGDTKIWVKDNRFTPVMFIQRFDFYVTLDEKRHTLFYPNETAGFSFFGISQLASEIQSFGLTNCETEIYSLLSEQYQLARDGHSPLNLVALKNKIQQIFIRNGERL